MPSAADLSDIELLVKQFQTPGDRSARWIAQRKLEDQGPALVAALEELASQRRIEVDEALYRDVLAAIHPGIGHIEKLRAQEVAERRDAARQLAKEAALAPLPRLALARLDLIAASESDALVWSDVLTAARVSPAALCERLALAALAHGQAQVRRRGCEYLAERGDARQAPALLDLLNDTDPVVARAAVVALGKCGPHATRDPLYTLLTGSDVPLRVQAAATLARWQDERGRAALERLALDESAATRRLAVVAMGELADRAFLPQLVAALDDQPSIRLAALTALPQAAGQDIPALQNPAINSAAEKAAAWRAWHAQH
jgi:hypothetical protein